MDRKNPRKNVSVLVSSVDHTIFDGLFHPTKKYYLPNGEPKIPSDYGASPEEMIMQYAASVPVAEQISSISPISLSGSMYVGGVLVKPMPAMTMDERLHSLYQGNTVMHNQPLAVRDAKLIRERLEIISSDDFE